MESALTLVTSDRRAEISQLIAERRYLLALQAISDNSNRADYRDLLDRTFNVNAYLPTEVHQSILEIDARVVITTNFDKIYERKCLGTTSTGYKVIPYYSGDLADELRSDARLIVKAHGSIDEIGKMVFTRSEYHQAKRHHPRFYEVLRSLFLTHTVVFVGCGLQDPDILLVLEDVSIAASGQKPHYAVMLQGESSVYECVDLARSYNVSVLAYEGGYAQLPRELGALQERVISHRASHPD